MIMKTCRPLFGILFATACSLSTDQDIKTLEKEEKIPWVYAGGGTKEKSQDCKSIVILTNQDGSKKVLHIKCSEVKRSGPISDDSDWGSGGRADEIDLKEIHYPIPQPPGDPYRK